MLIHDMNTGDRFEGYYILQNIAQRTTAAGKPFLTLNLADRSGAVTAQVWDYTGPIGPGDVGKVAWAAGLASEYRGAPQLTVYRIRLAEEDEGYKISDLVATAPIEMDETWAWLQETVDSIQDEDYRAVCREMLKIYGKQFRLIPAAKSMHHGFVGGLLMHTAYMVKAAGFYAGLYPAVDRSLLLAGTLLHDFCKCEEFVTSALGLVAEYSLKGQLIGHLVLGAEAVSRVAASLGIPEEKSVLLQHMILSHHGEPEFGAAVRPMCIEAELLSYLDLIDSRMEIYTEVMEETPVGTFSGRIFALDKRIYHHA